MLCDAGLETFLDEMDSAESLNTFWAGLQTFFAGRQVDGVAYVMARADVVRGNERAAMRVLQDRGGAVACVSTTHDVSLCSRALWPLLAGRRPVLMAIGEGATAPVGTVPDLGHGLYEQGFRAVCVLPLPVVWPGRGVAGVLMMSRGDAAGLRRALEQDGGGLVLAVAHAHGRLMRLDGWMTESGGRPLPALTHREEEVLVLSARGLTTRELGEAIGISVSAVNFHLANAGRKLQASNRTHAVSRAIALGLIAP